ncbi:MAG: septum formation initiator family protein [Firmicutes bacterium]|nr:septum formation initiator family protein [Bacillota bacterium]
MAEEVISLEARRRQSKRPRKRWRITPRFFLFLLVVILIWVGVGFANRYLHIVLLQGKIVKVEREIAAIKSRNKAIRQQIEEMQSDAYIEKVAREKLGLIKPGETVYIPMRSAMPDEPADVQKRSDKDGLADGGY